MQPTRRSRIATLTPWLGEGQTIAFVGSSGVGKSTLINSLLGTEAQATAEIREDDGKGRHTTTARHLIRTPGGVWLIDTPGMRELKIGAVRAGLSRAFMDIEDLAKQCRFRDCSHQQDSGCALHAAVKEGRLDARRFTSYMKLWREAERAAQTPWQRHQAQRQFGRVARAAQKAAPGRQGAGVKACAAARAAPRPNRHWWMRGRLYFVRGREVWRDSSSILTSASRS